MEKVKRNMFSFRPEKNNMVGLLEQWYKTEKDNALYICWKLI